MRGTATKLFLIHSLICLGLTSTSPAIALDYNCPSDPGFCYLDLADDGCFDPGDTPDIDALLIAGDFPNPLPPGSDLPVGAGSIVCPPSVGRLKLAAGADWRTALGSSITIHSAFVRSAQEESIQMLSGDELSLGGKVLQPGGSVASIRLRAENDVQLENHVKLRGANDALEVESLHGDILVAPRVKISTSSSDSNRMLAPEGEIVLMDRNRIEAIRLSGLHLTATNARFQRFFLAFMDEDISLFGKTTLSGGATFLLADGDIHAERLSVVGKGGGARIEGASVTLAGPNGKLKTGRLSGEVEITSTSGPVVVDDYNIQSLDTLIESATDLTLRDSVLRGFSPLGAISLTTGGGCDLTGTQFKRIVPTTNCP